MVFTDARVSSFERRDSRQEMNAEFASAEHDRRVEREETAMEGFNGSPGLASLDDNAHVQVDYREMEGEEHAEEGTGVAVRGSVMGGGGRSGGRALRGYNWTEQENLILIEQKRLEHEERHRRGAASEKFVHGKEAWRIVMEGCNAQVGFRERDQNQVCNKWDSLGKEFKRIRDYLGSSVAVEWWNLPKLDKKELARTRKLPLEFTEAMYKALDPWHGQRMAMANYAGSSVVDTDRDASSQPGANRFGRVRRAGKAAGSKLLPGSNAATGSPSPTSRMERSYERTVSSCPEDGVRTELERQATPLNEVGARALGRGVSSCPENAVPASSAATATPPTPSSAPSEGRTRSSNAPAPSTELNTPDDGTPSSGRRKRKVAGTDNLERDLYEDYLAPVDAQDAEERAWRSSMLKLHSDREARLASKDAQAATMEECLYQLEVKRTARMERMYELEMQKQLNIGNMTNALLKMANSIENMTR